MKYQYFSLLNSGSKAMNVNGSVTPKAFTYTSSGDSSVKSIIITLQDEGTTSLNKFGAITALSNGLLLEWTIGGNSTTLATLVDNSDLCNLFKDHQHFGNSAVLSIVSVVTPEGFGNTNNILRGTIEFDTGVILNDSDVFKATVRDNLTGIDSMTMGVVVQID